MNNRIGDLQHELERAEIEARRAENEWTFIQTTAAEKTLQLGNVILYDRSLKKNRFHHFFSCRAVRNLHQLVLRQQKTDKEDEEAETEDPIKRVRQQLDKVKTKDKWKFSFPFQWHFSSSSFRFTCLFMTSQRLPMRWNEPNKHELELVRQTVAQWMTNLHAHLRFSLSFSYFFLFRTKYSIRETKLNERMNNRSIDRLIDIIYLYHIFLSWPSNNVYPLKMTWWWRVSIFHKLIKYWPMMVLPRVEILFLCYSIIQHCLGK